VILQAFKDFYQRETEPWELHLVGHIDQTDEVSVELLDRLKKDAEGLPVVFHLNLPHLQLRQELFGAARLYWQASGFGCDVEANPSWAESFGMATVEAMAEGVVPLAYREGGPLEILDFDPSLLWRTTDELVQQSRILLQSEQRWQLLSERCRERAADFSRDRFQRSWLQLVEATLRHA
jgi:glycosyltransferase involved in cell wall biosynthesis